MAVRVLRQVLIRAGVPAEAARGYVYNSLRRFLPTAAGILNFPRDISQSLGHWVENTPLGIGGEIAGHPPMPMCAVYNDQRALASGVAKQQVLATLIDALGLAPGAMQVLLGGDFVEDLLPLSWEDVALAHAAATRPSLPASTSSGSTPSTAPPSEQPATSPAFPTGTKRKVRDSRPSAKYRTKPA